MRGRTVTVTALVCALLLTGCSRYDDNVLVENGLDVPVVFSVEKDPPPSYEGHPDSFDPAAIDPDDKTEFSLRWPDPDPPWHIWPLSELKDPPCREGLHIVAYTEDERTIVRDPPVCPADFWTVTD